MPPPTTQRTAAVVLLVQPPDDSRDMYAEFLRHHGMDVVCPGDVEEALKLAAAADVVVTGLQLPGAMDGFAFIQHLRAASATRRKPIIVVTSWAWQTERLRAKDAGCDVFLTKPCLPAELLSHVRRRLTTARRRPGSKRRATN
jgi:DNA-binding response OmpR family regulator